MLIEAAIPGARNAIRKEADLIIEIQGMWNVKAKVIPVIKGATDFKIIQTIPEQHTGKARN